MPEPAVNQVYRRPDGLPALFVRTETRFKKSGPENLFVYTHDRIVFSWWIPESEGVPEDLELIVDRGGRSDAEALAGELEKQYRRCDVFERVLKLAVGMLPTEGAQQLRKAYKDGCSELQIA
jgi:hypothetical protein